MKLKRILASILALCMVLSTMGTIAFAEDVAVATVNGVDYETFDAAYKAAEDGDTIELLETVVIEGMIVNYNKTVTVKAEGLDTAFLVSDNAFMVTFGGMTIESTGACITVGESADSRGPTVDINGGTYKGGTSAITVVSGLVRINDGVFSADDNENTIIADTKNVNANGGKFYNFDPIDYVPANRFTEQDSEGYYTVVEAAAQIGDVKYADLASAIKAAQEGETVTLLRNINLGDAEAIGIRRNITIDGEGYWTITFNSVSDAWGINNAAFYASGPVAYTVKNLTIVLKNAASNFAAFKMKSGGTLENVTVKGAFGNGVDVTSAAALTVTDCTFDGVAVGVNAPHSYAPYSTVTITGTTFNTTEAAAVLYENAIFTDNIIAADSYVQASGYLDVSKNFWNGDNTIGGAPTADQLKGDSIICDTYYAANNDGVLGDLTQNGEAEAPVIRIEVGDETYEYGLSKLALLSNLIGSDANGDTKITLLDNVTLENGIQVAAYWDTDAFAAVPKTVEIDLNDKTLTGFIQINGNVTGTIKNGTVNNTNSKYPAIDVSGKATLEALTVNSVSEAFEVYDDAKLTVKSGTYSSNPADYLAEGYISVENGDGTFDVIAPVEVSTYEELAALFANGTRKPVNAILMNDITGTAKLQNGYEGGATGIVVQAGDLLNGNDKKLTINGANSTWACAIAMKGGEVKNLTIAGAMRGVFMPGANGNVIIDNCVFEDVIYTFNSDSGSKDYTVTVKNSTLNGWTSFSNAHKSVTFENCTFGEGNDYAFCRPYQPTIFTGCEFNEGFEFDTSKTAANSFEFNDCTYAGEELSEETAAPMFADGGTVVIDGESVEFDKYVPPVAQIGDDKFDTLHAAINAAKDGDTVKLLTSITLSDTDMVKESTGSYNVMLDVSGKSIILDLNEKTIDVDYNGGQYLYAVICIEDGASLTILGNGGIDIKENGENVAYMFWKRGTTGHLTIENGTYHMNDSGDSMVYTNGHEIVTVKGGTWTLDAVGTRENRFPCIFNAQGTGGKSIIVTGGTFNDDINHQHWGDETVVPTTHYVQKNEDGTWTVKPGAVAYVNQGILTGPYFVAKDFGYATFEEAYNNAGAGNTITLLADVKLTEKLTITKPITIDGNGHSIIADETAVWYTVSGKLNIKNYNVHLIGINSNNVTLKNIVLDNNNNAAGINLYCAQNVVFDNVSIINATKGFAALTVNGSTLTVKTKFVALGNSVAIDMDLGSGVTSPLGVTVEEGTIFDLGGKTVKFDSAAVNDMTGAITEDNKPYFAAMDNAYYYTEAQMESRTTAFGNGLTLLADVELSKDISVNGTLDPNGNTLTIADGKVLKVDSNLTVTENGTIDAEFNLTNNAVTITGPEGLNVTTDIEGYVVKYDNGKYSLKQVVAKIGAAQYASLKDAFEAAQNGDTVKLFKDISLSEMLTNTKKITLDLNGKTITGTDNTEKNFSLIDNRGELTITGNGTMTLTATVNSGWNRYSAVLANNPGGKLVVENGTIEHLGGTDMAYGIDNLTNGKGTYAETVINGGTIKSTYRGIRQFLNGIEAQNILTVNGGTVEGANKSIWMQDPSKNANSGTLTVADGATLNGDVYLFVTAGSTEWPVEVSIAASAVNGEVLSANLPLGYEVVNENGYYGVKNSTSSGYTITAIASQTEVRYNNNNTPDSFTVTYVATGGDVIGAMAQLEYSTELFECDEDPNATGRIRMNSNSLKTDENGKTVIKELHFTVKGNVATDTTYTFVPQYVQVVSDYDAAGSGTQNGFVENVIGVDVTVIAQYDVTLPTNGSIEGNTYVDQEADYTATIKDFDENKTYTITYTMEGTDEPQSIEVTKDTNGEFVIENVTGDIVFTDVTSKLNCEIVLFYDIINGYTLVMVKDGVSAGYTYNGAPMYAIERYEDLTAVPEAVKNNFVGDITNAASVRAILIKGGTTEAAVREVLEASDVKSEELEKSFDVNGDRVLWYGDAMVAHGCYTEQYKLAQSMAWYLRSDVNTDFKVNVLDYDATVEAVWADIDN